MAHRSKRDWPCPSQEIPPPDYSVDSDPSKPHIPLSKFHSIPDEHGFSPLIPIGGEHANRFHPGLTEECRRKRFRSDSRSPLCRHQKSLSKASRRPKTPIIQQGVDPNEKILCTFSRAVAPGFPGDDPLVGGPCHCTPNNLPGRRRKMSKTRL